MPQQTRGRTIEPAQVAIGQARQQAAAQGLAELDAPLIEAVDTP